MTITQDKLCYKFIQIPTELLTDNRLSNGAKIMYCYLAGKPEGWNVRNKEIQKSLCIKDAGTVAKYRKELLTCGWVSKTRMDINDYEYELTYENLEVCYGK